LYQILPINKLWEGCRKIFPKISFPYIIRDKCKFTGRLSENRADKMRRLALMPATDEPGRR
jgi:hypothetical protein